ncbi:MAG: tRNA threonylcarbamoyladenosine dehydratase [Ruminococcaceae bacterium]|nr:tRNA threonylcarbamoyladenosine dehydratase [Oscillospiraceae bacterium]
MDERFSRSARIFGIENQKKLNNAKVLVFGLGGVGGAVCEALARSGVGTLGLVDKDIVDITNINRQLIATESTVGMKKTDACEKRLVEINPGIKLNKYDLFYLPETADTINLSEYDYIVDAIDNVTAKIELIKRAKEENIKIISSMGTGNKMHPEMLEIQDISKTSVCPLARVIRRELRNKGINHLTVVYSKEEPQNVDGDRTPASSTFVPISAGILIASKVVQDILEIK